MNIRWFLVALILLGMEATGSLANTSIAIYYGPPDSVSPLTVNSTSTIPLPSETLVYLFEDIDGDGPDLDDPLAQHQADMGNGRLGGYGIVQNRLPMNENAGFETPGYVAITTGYGAGNIPPIIRIFLRILCEEGDILWESRVLEVIPLSYNEFILTEHDWTCYDCLAFELCDPTRTVQFESEDGIPQADCAFICPNIRTWVRVGGLAWTYETSTIEFSASSIEACMDQVCPDVTPSFEVWTDGFTAHWPPQYCVHRLWGNEPGCIDVEWSGLQGVRLDTIYAEVLPDTTRLHLITERESNIDYFRAYKYLHSSAVCIGVFDVPATNRDTGEHYIINDTDVMDDMSYDYAFIAPYIDIEHETWLQIIHVSRHDTIQKVERIESLLAQEFRLLQNYPNPFNPSTSIAFELPQASEVLLKVYDVNGREVATLLNQTMSAGRHDAEFKAESLPSGVYFYQLTAGVFTDTKKMLLLK